MNIYLNPAKKACLFIAAILFILSFNSYSQSYLPLTGGTLTGNLTLSSGTQLQAPYYGLNSGIAQPANSGSMRLFDNSTSHTLDVIGDSWGWRFIPPNSSTYAPPVFSIDQYGNATLPSGGLFIQNATDNFGSSLQSVGAQIRANNQSTLDVTAIDGIQVSIRTFPGSYNTTNARMLNLTGMILPGSGHTITNAASIAMGSMHAATNNCDFCLLLNGTDTQPTGNYGIFDNSAYNNYFNSKVGIGSASPLDKLDIAGTTATNPGRVVFGDGNNYTPYMKFYKWAGTGSSFLQTTIGNSLDAAGAISFQTGAGGGVIGGGDAQTTKLIITQPGNVGIGTTSPQNKLDVQGGNADVYNTAAATTFTVGSSATGKTNLVFSTSADAGGYGIIQSVSAQGSTNGNTVINPIAGNVLIGKTSENTGATYLLDVNGSERANAITVNTTGADFVFEPAYHLNSLAFVENYINQNHHLPEIASAKEMQTNGLNLGDNETKLLQKVEELTLYLIEKDKKVNALEDKLNAQQAQMDKLTKAFEELSKKQTNKSN